MIILKSVQSKFVTSCVYMLFFVYRDPEALEARGWVTQACCNSLIYWSAKLTEEYLEKNLNVDKHFSSDVVS